MRFDLSAGRDGAGAVTWASGGYVRVALRGSDRKWTTTRISSGRNAVFGPAVAITGRGEVVVAWVQSSSPAGATTIRGPLTIRARTRGAGGNWGSERTLGRTAHFIESDLDVAANPSGEAIAVWRGTRTASTGRPVDALQSAFRRPSTAFGGTQTVREPADGRAGATEIVIGFDERGTTYAAWTGGSTPVVRLATRTRGPHGSWNASQVSPPGPASRPVIAVGGDRSATIAWRAARLDTEGEGTQTAPSTFACAPAAGASREASA